MKIFLALFFSIISIGCTSKSKIENWHNNPGKIVMPREIYLIDGNPSYIYEVKPVVSGRGVNEGVQLDSVVFSQGAGLGLASGAGSATSFAVGVGVMSLKAMVDAFKDSSFTEDDVKRASDLYIVYAESAYGFKGREDHLRKNKQVPATYGIFPVLVRFEGAAGPSKKHDYAVFLKTKERLRGHTIYRGIPLGLATPDQVNSKSYLKLLQDQQKTGTLPRSGR